MKRKLSLFSTCVVLLSLFLSGCAIKGISELYAMPERSADYQALQTAVNAVLSVGAQYSSPIAGTNRQPVQMADLDGDGKDEAIVYATTGGETPLKAFVLDHVNGEYVNICTIEGGGSNFDRVEYAQLDGVGGSELIIGRQVGGQTLQAMGVYSIVDGQPEEKLTANYSEFTLTDLDGDENSDLFLLRFDAETRDGTAEFFHWKNGVLERQMDTSVTLKEAGVRQISIGQLSRQYRGIFVSGILEDGSAATDVYTLQNEVFTHVSSVTTMELSSLPVRGYNVYATDVDNDGIVEFPQVKLLPAIPGEAGESSQHIISWFNYDPEVGLSLKQNTYHSFTGGWYLRLPTRLGTRLQIGRSAEVGGVSGLGFYTADEEGNPESELFSVYTLTGSTRNTITPEDGRFVLSARGETTYAARLGAGARAVNLTKDEVTAMFNYIQTSRFGGAV